MRLKTIVLILFISCVHHICFGQTDKRNIVENKKLSVVNRDNNVYTFGSAKQLQNAFGTTKAIKHDGEMLEHQGYIYKYQGLEVFFDGINFDSITIKGNLYKFLIGGQTYTIGDDCNKFKIQFPQSFKERESNGNGGRCWIGIKNTDAFILITYNKKGIINEIWMGNDNS